MKHANPHSTPVTLSFTKVIGLLTTQISYLKIESSEIDPSDLEDYIYPFVNYAARADQQRTRREKAEKEKEIELGMIDPQQGKLGGSQKKEKNSLHFSTNYPIPSSFKK